MLRGIQVALGIVVLVFLPGLIEGFETPKAAAVRIAGLSILAIACASPAVRRSVRRTPLDLAFAAWLVVEALSTLFSRAPLTSVFGDSMQHEGLLTTLGLAGLYAGVRIAVRGPEQAARIVDAVLAAVTLACGYALLQAAHLDPAPWRGVATIGPTLRPFGTLGQANVLAATTAAAVALALGRRTMEPRRSPLWAGVAVVAAATTLLTLSRSGLLALIVALAMTLALRVRSAGQAKRVAWRWVIAGSSLAGLLVAFMARHEVAALSQRLLELLSPSTGSARSRWEIWRSAMAAWRARPILGQGPGTFELVFTQFQTPEYWRFEIAGPAAHAHNVYLHALATRGMLGLACLLAIAATFGSAARTAWQRMAAARPLFGGLAGACAAYAVAGSFGALGIAGAAILVALAACVSALASAATAAAPEHAARSRGETTTGPKRSRTAKVRLATAVAAGPAWLGLGVGVLALGGSVNEFTQSHAVAQAAAWDHAALAAPAGSPAPPYAVMSERCRVAASRLPYDDLPPRERAEVLLHWAEASPEEHALLVEATESAREAVRRAPLRAVDRQRLADALVARIANGERELIPESEAVFESASHLAPSDGLLLVAWAQARLRTGRAAAALVPARRAVTLYPASAHAREIDARIQLALGDTTAALASLRLALAGDWYGDPNAPRRAEQEVRDLLAAPSATRP